jgi:uncharacterized repeat protein (TIGR01451 family)
MINTVPRIALLLLLALFPCANAALAADEIRFASIAEIEIEQVNDKGEKVVVRQPAVLLQPGEIAIYTNSFTNLGPKAADKVTLGNPVPENTEYLGGSATETGFDLLFSVDDGKSFAKPQALTVPDGKGGVRPAEPKDYTHLRWTMLQPLKPGATGVVEFRVRVK